MAQPTTSEYWNQTTPAAPTGDQNVVVQTDGATPQQSLTAFPQKATASLRGTVKPDGTSTTVDATGTLSAAVTPSKVQQEAFTYAADTGSANAYAVTLSPAPTIVAGSLVVFKAANANTGASTLAVNGGAATAIKKQGSTALASGDIAAGQIVTVVYDGTNFQLSAAAPSGSSSTYYGNAAVNSSSTFNVITTDSTPITGSISIYIDGALVAPNTYSVSGASVTLTAPVYGSHVVVATWATTNSTPGTITLSTSGIGRPTVRGSGIQYATTSTITVSWPAGTVAGDLAVICIQASYNTTVPSGWTTNDNHVGATVNGAVFSKVLTSADISTGSVAVSLAGAYGATAAIVTFVGSTAGIRETVAKFSVSNTSSSLQTSTSGSVVTTDVALYFAANRDANDSVTVNRGSQLRTVSGAQSSGTIYEEDITTAGAVQPTMSYSGANTGYYQATVIVRGV